MPKNAAERIEDRLTEVDTKLAALDAKQAALEKSYTTCTGDACKRDEAALAVLAEQKATLGAMAEQLKAALTALPTQIDAAVKAHVSPLGSRFDSLEAAQKKAAENSVAKEEMEFPEEAAILTCPSESGCDAVLDVTQDKCPACGTPIEWDSTLDSMKDAIHSIREEAAAEAAKKARLR